jgi:polyphenol oxidase
MTTRRYFIRTLSAACCSSVALPSRAPAFTQDPPNACPTPPHGGAFFIPGQDRRPIGMRKPVSAYSQTEIADLRRAFAALRALPSKDPRSWTMQADLHASYCRQCTNATTQVHGSWSFLPWHRAFLYYYERILGSLIGKIDNFRLPYWDWENARTFPYPYVTPTGNRNPLWDAGRNAFLLAGVELPITDATARRTAFLDCIADFALYGGTATVGGAMEIDPHNVMHVDIGMQEPPWMDMGNFGFSARDPLFFAHHANVDKLWSHWSKRYENPEETSFRDLRWTFYDEHGRTVSISAGDVLAHEKHLRYSYAPSAIPISIQPLRISYPCRLRCCAHGGSILEAVDDVRERVIETARNTGEVAWVLPHFTVPNMFSGTFDVFAYRNGRKTHFANIVIADAGMLMRGNRQTTLAFDVGKVIENLLDVRNPAAIYALSRYGGAPFSFSAQAMQLRVPK